MKSTTSLGETCRFVGGGTPSRKIRHFWSGQIPWATVKDFRDDRISHTDEYITQEGLDRSASKLVPSGTVLLVTRVGLGKVAIADVDLAINQDVKAIFPSEELLPEFLFWILKQLGPEIERMGTGATVKGITLQDVWKLKIPLPLLDEQQRIVNILNRATKIERLRKQAQERLREFIPALFIKMFGDPVDNPLKWKTGRLGTLGSLDRGRSRHRPRDARELYGGPYPFVQTGDIANADRIVQIASQTYSEIGLRQSKLWPAGTLCITIAANIGKTGILEFDACFPDSIVGFTPHESVKVEYVQSALDLMQQRIEETAPMAAQRNINLQTLRELEIPVPDLSKQQKFVEIVESARIASTRANSGCSAGAKLTSSLMTDLLGVAA